MKANEFIIIEGAFWDGILKGLKKSACRLQPIFEAITNSLESISMYKRIFPSDVNGEIRIDVHYRKSLFSDMNDFNKIVITDTGIGFDDDNFGRVFRYKDTRKGFNNRGSGRVQFLHFFKETNYESVYRDGNVFYKRNFTLSKSERYIAENAIILHNFTDVISSDTPIETRLTFTELLDDKDIRFYTELDIFELKEVIIQRYLMYFCTHRESIPNITINKYIGDELTEDISIESKDIPQFEQEKDINVHYSKISNDMKRVEKSAEKELFNIKAYKLNKDKLRKNEIKLTSKEEIIDNLKVKMDYLNQEDTIEDMRYLFLISSSYLDNLDGDNRGELEILNKTDYKKKAKEYGSVEEEILIDEIEDQVNRSIVSMYHEIEDRANTQQEELIKLKEMFLLNDETLNSLKINLNDTEDKILEKVYSADAKIIAEQDAAYKKCVDTINELNPSSENYNESFEELVTKLVTNISLQNRTTLSRYVARRKLVIDLFGKILDKKLNIQTTATRNEDEKLLHNLIFQQKSDSPDSSDLWILNEEFLYFKGCSELRLCDIKIGGLPLFRDEVTEEESKYLFSLGEDRTKQRPDILLFPDEGKCIIIELKNPNVNVSTHLTQINNYATLIRNYTTSDFEIDTFYGYFIGAGIEPRDVRSHDADFKEAHKFKFLYRANKTIAGEDNRNDGSLYTEVISYSVLRDRALLRNKIYVDKLMGVNPK